MTKRTRRNHTTPDAGGATGLLAEAIELGQSESSPLTHRLGGEERIVVIGPGKVSGLTLLTFPVGGILGGLIGGWAGQRLGLQTVYLLFIPAVFALLAWQWRSRAA